MQFLTITVLACSLIGCSTLGINKHLSAPTATPSKPNRERWQNDINVFLAEDEKSPPAEGDVVFTGSSSIRLWDLKRDFPDLPAHNRGFGGSSYADLVEFIDVLIIKHRPSIVVIYSGGNDINGGKTAEQVRDDAHILAWNVFNHLPDTHIILFAVKPSPNRWDKREEMIRANGYLTDLCNSDDRLHFINTWPLMLKKDGMPDETLFVQDMLHLNQTGYALWTNLLKEQLELLMK